MGFGWAPISHDPKMLSVRDCKVMVLLCCLDSVGKTAAEVLRHVASIFTWLDSKLLKLRGFSPLLSIDFDLNFNTIPLPITIINNGILDLKIIKMWGAMFTIRFFSDISYKGQVLVRLWLICQPWNQSMAPRTTIFLNWISFPCIFPAGFYLFIYLFHC